ncbi:MAG: hypothetical protein ACRD38_08670 [Nitrososphaerales archaeon]
MVSTKLTEEEHTKLLDLCNKSGCTPSALIKQAIMEKIGTLSETKVTKNILDDESLGEILKSLKKEKRGKLILRYNPTHKL